MPSGLYYHYSLDESICELKGILVYIIFNRYTSEFHPNYVDPEQTPCLATADLGLHSWLMSILRGTR